jgi:hypothetical protein
MDSAITLTQIRNEIRGYQFRHANEVELHAGIEKILAGLGLTVEREVCLDRHSRIDLVATLPARLRLGIEVKIAGQGGEVARQVRRYADFAELGAVLLVTTVARHMFQLMAWAEPVPGPPGFSRWILCGKPFDAVVINRGRL